MPLDQLGLASGLMSSGLASLVLSGDAGSTVVAGLEPEPTQAARSRLAAMANMAKARFITVGASPCLHERQA
jgi:hypothetical protein